MLIKLVQKFPVLATKLRNNPVLFILLSILWMTAGFMVFDWLTVGNPLVNLRYSLLTGVVSGVLISVTLLSFDRIRKNS